MEVHVITGKGSITPNEPDLKIYPVMEGWSWSELPRLMLLMRRVSPDAVLLYYIGYIYKHHPMITFVPTLVRRLLPTVPFVTLISHVFGATSADDSPLARLIHKSVRLAMGQNVDYSFGTIFRDSDRLIVLSERHKDLIAQHSLVASNRCVLIPPPPIMPIVHDGKSARVRGREQLNISDEDFLVTYFGNVCPNKGLETLLKAFFVSVRSNKSLRLSLVGRIPDDQLQYASNLKHMCCELGLEDAVTFTGGFPFDSDQASIFLRRLTCASYPLMKVFISTTVHS